jgi:hypothetical protein
MSARQCYHCKNWIEEGEPHDCWTTTEAALTRDLSEDLRDAWERLRETAAEFGDQRIYASLNSIMFSRKSCYFFVRPKRTYLEVCVFLGRTVKAPQVHRVQPASKTKTVHTLRITHRDQVETPLTDWLREAYAFAAPTVASERAPAGRTPATSRTAKAPKAASASRAESAPYQKRTAGAKKSAAPARAASAAAKGPRTGTKKTRRTR